MEVRFCLLDDLEVRLFADPLQPALYDDARQMIARFKDEYWIVGVTVTTIWETAWALRGYERMLSDLVSDPDLADAILDIPYNDHLTAAKKLAIQ